jgi:predicted porin
MQKKIIALAIASALTAPALALADSANANFYGVLNADVELVSVGTVPAVTAPTLAQASHRGRVTSNASRLGLNGSDDLGNGLTAIYQIETRVNLVGNEVTAGTTNAGAAPNNTTSTNVGIFDGIRNSNLGLKGAFGTVFVGQWDTPYKTSHNKVELFDNTTIATATALLGSVGGSQNKFNVRQGSSVQYWTPDMSGFSVKAAYSTKNDLPEAANSGGTPSLLSLSAAYDVGPIYVAVAHESHKAAPVTATGAPEVTDSGLRLVGAYTMDAYQVGVTYESITLGGNGSTTTDAKRTAFSLEGKYNLPTGTVGLTYTKAGDLGNNTASTNVDTGATQVSLRYGYMMSKRTEAYGMYTNISNKAKGTYNFSDVAAMSAAAGSSVSGFGVGVRHTF